MQRSFAQWLRAEAGWRQGRAATVTAPAAEAVEPGGVAPAVVAGFRQVRTHARSATREMFRVELYQDDHAVALVSEATTEADGTGKYELRLIAESASADPRLVRVDHVCTACVALGLGPRGDACLECGGAGWEPWFGEAAAMDLTLETPLAIRVLAVPRSSLYLPEHTRRLATARRDGLLIEIAQTP
ncbi:MAG: hypothetical protein R3F39_05670 [Myxococcota bacterium]